MAKQKHFIREWRKFRYLTQEQLGERVGYDRTYISKIEKGLKRYDQPFLEATAHALRCQPADLIMRDPNKASAWALLQSIPEADQPKVIQILQAFTKTGTDG